MSYSPPYFDVIGQYFQKFPSIWLFRHAERHRLPKDRQAALAIGLTEIGAENSLNFGKFLAKSFPDLSLDLKLSSPAVRCQETITHLTSGFSQIQPQSHQEGMEVEALLTGRKMFETVEGLDALIECLYRQEISDRVVQILSGKAEPGFYRAGGLVLEYLQGQLDRLPDRKNAFGLACTHDFVLIMLIICYFMPLDASEIWPIKTMEGVLVQKLPDETLQIVWRDKVLQIPLQSA